MKKWILIFVTLTLVIIGTAGYFGFQGNQPSTSTAVQAPPTVQVKVCDVRQTVTAPGNLVNRQEVTLEMPVAGRLETIDVLPGDPVKKGQVLARVGEAEKFQAAVTTAELELLQAQHALEELQQNAPKLAAEAQLALTEAQTAYDKALRKRNSLNYARTGDELVIENARAEYLLAEKRLKKAQAEFDKVAHKHETDPVRAMALTQLMAAREDRNKKLATLNWYTGKPTQTEIDATEAALAVAEANLKQAQQAWDELKAGPTELDLTLAEAKIQDAEAKLEQAQAELSSLEIRSPQAGVVLEIKANPGQSLPSGSQILVLNDPQQVEVEATVIEEDLPYVQPGQGVEVFFDAMPEETFSGVVSRIVPQRLSGDRPLYALYITLDHVPAGLVAGMTADASVFLAERPGVLCLPRATVRAGETDEAIVEVWTGSQTEKRTIQVGLRGDVNVEILSGLKEGDLVVAK